MCICIHMIGLKQVISEFRSYNVFRGPISVLETLFYLLDYSKAEVTTSEGKPDWKKMRMKFGDELFQRIKDYESSTGY